MKLIFSNTIFLLIAFFIQNCHSQNGFTINSGETANGRVRLNSKANFKFTDWIANIPEDKNLEGKFIVLEFWASWCKPCLEQVSHLNELQSKFNDKNLYFISMTDEKPDVVKSILKRVHFESIVVSDQRKINTFWNGGIKKLILPFTILIDDEGYIKWIGTPSLLREKDIQDLMTKKIIPFNLYEREKK